MYSEIFKPTNVLDPGSPENKIRAVCLIPGSGEYVYDTIERFKDSAGLESMNKFIIGDDTNVVRSIDQLMATLPNLTDVSLVVNWFVTVGDLNFTAEVKPGVEQKATWPAYNDPWRCAGYNRGSAHQIGNDTLGNLAYGGTPSDDSVRNIIRLLKERGLYVTLYPMVMVDDPDKPWRGRLNSSSIPVNRKSHIITFFDRTNGYRRFIRHYAQLGFEENIDSLIIGSEFVAMTSHRDPTDGDFPAVDKLIELAAEVREIVGPNIKLGYAADWSEYHHTDGGYYNLDPLWASENIDFIGIDAYFPLTDRPEWAIDYLDIVRGWTTGEGYEWYYTDGPRTTKAYLEPKYAWKNLSWWWNNEHFDPGNVKTAWVPRSKPIWFTEIGYPSVDGASNQPNVFYDPSSSESALPRFSTGSVDNTAQRRCLRAAFETWWGSKMVEKMFVWAWDARPYPVWPEMSEFWGDSELYAKGHWIQGKLATNDFGIAASYNPVTVNDAGGVEKSRELFTFMMTSPATDVLLETIELSHPSWSKTYRIIRNDCLGASLNTENGPFFFQYVPFNLRQSGDSGDLNKKISVELSDLGEIIPEEFRRMEDEGTLNTAPKMVVRCFSHRTGEMVLGPVKLDIRGAVLIADKGCKLEASAKATMANSTGTVFDIERIPTIKAFL
jgi:hypothetical protein